MRNKVDFYRSVGFILFEYALTKPDQDVSDAREKVKQARKQGKMAAKAIQTNPKNPRYQKDLMAANRKLNQSKPKASKPMTHER